MRTGPIGIFMAKCRDPSAEQIGVRGWVSIMHSKAVHDAHDMTWLRSYPLQMLLLLSQPGQDFTGGRFFTLVRALG